MFRKKVLELINNDNHYVVDKCVLKCAKQMKLDINSFMLLIYLLNHPNKEIFDYKKILNDLNFSEQELVDSISLLKDNKVLAIEMKKNDLGILEERVNISAFYDVLSSKILDEDNVSTNDKDLYDVFEKEFGRTLSPMEYEIINGWLESKIDKELIICALKETVFNGVNNLRYVDKILYEWNKKGIKVPNDVKKAERDSNDENEQPYYEYDWLNED